jgi:hypothetical protein
MYAPARDVTYLFPEVVKAVAGMLEDEKEPDIHDWLKDKGVTMDMLGDAAGAFCTFMNLAHEDPKENMERALERAGWFKVPAPARFAYVYYLGTCMAGTFFMGIRDVIRLGQPTLATIEQLGWAAKRARLYTRMSRWQRFLYRWFEPWRKSRWRKHRIRES